MECVGEVLLDRCDAVRADLLVMGARTAIPAPRNSSWAA